MNIAVTGTVGSGKSGVAAILAAALGIESVDTDLLCRKLLLPGQPGWRDLRDRLRGRFFGADGGLDRLRLREAVFAEPEVRRELERILHPRVREMVTVRMREATGNGLHLLVEVPLLFEAGWQGDFDQVVAVYAPAALCIARTVKRDRVSRHQAESILALQLPAEEKARRADRVVDNSGIWSATVLQVSVLARKLQLPCLDWRKQG